jgi:hypothetical protein
LCSAAARRSCWYMSWRSNVSICGVALKKQRHLILAILYFYFNALIIWSFLHSFKVCFFLFLFWHSFIFLLINVTYLRPQFAANLRWISIEGGGGSTCGCGVGMRTGWGECGRFHSYELIKLIFIFRSFPFAN